MLGGNGETLDLILITLRILRELQSPLPVEVWHLPGELTPANETSLRELGATPRDLGGDVLVPMRAIKGREKNFQIKVAAWVNSGFEEIIGLDSDVLPVRELSYLFEMEEYKQYGQIFWPDWWKTHGSISSPQIFADNAR
jgi:alpha 1,2-mannosyltransferase